ncbi:MAG: methyltransferase domain-containing protein [Anaerolineae bacterium]|nr:methyltransferase domain-containing protein [Anaerolineae bacterium]
MDQHPRAAPPPAETQRDRYYAFLAELGFTKHLGSLNSTRELIELCHIAPGQHVLDVGCGVGMTPRYLAQRHTCRVVGLDVTPRMIERARQHAVRAGVDADTAFVIGDAAALPFASDTFDVVLTESVNVFLPDRPRAIREYVRVCAPGGYVALNEMTLLARAPSSDLAAYLERVTGTEGDLLLGDEWRVLLQEAGLHDIDARPHRLEIGAEARARLERFGVREMLLGVYRALRAFLVDPASRAFYRQMFGDTGVITPRILDYLGYGVYVGRKPEAG